MSDFLTEDPWDTIKKLIEDETTYTVNPRGSWYNEKKGGTQVILLREDFLFNEIDDSREHYMTNEHFDLHIFAATNDNMRTAEKTMRELFMDASKCRPPTSASISSTKIKTVRIDHGYNFVPGNITQKEKKDRGRGYHLVIPLTVTYWEDSGA